MITLNNFDCQSKYYSYFTVVLWYILKSLGDVLWIGAFEGWLDIIPHTSIRLHMISTIHRSFKVNWQASNRAHQNIPNQRLDKVRVWRYPTYNPIEFRRCTQYKNVEERDVSMWSEGGLSWMCWWLNWFGLGLGLMCFFFL